MFSSTKTLVRNVTSVIDVQRSEDDPWNHRNYFSTNTKIDFEIYHRILF